MSSKSYMRECKHCNRTIQLRQMPAGQWVAFEGEEAHDCKAAPAPKSSSSLGPWSGSPPTPSPLPRVGSTRSFSSDEDDDEDDLLETPIHDLGFPATLVEKLSRLGIASLAGLKSLTSEELNSLEIGQAKLIKKALQDALSGKLTKSMGKPASSLSSGAGASLKTPYKPGSSALTVPPPKPVASQPIARIEPKSVSSVSPESVGVRTPAKSGASRCGCIAGLLFLLLTSLSTLLPERSERRASRPSNSTPAKHTSSTSGSASTASATQQSSAPKSRPQPSFYEGYYLGYEGGSGAGTITIARDLSPTSDRQEFDYERSQYRGGSFGELSRGVLVAVQCDPDSHHLVRSINVVQEGPETVEARPWVESSAESDEQGALASSSPWDRAQWAEDGHSEEARAAKAVHQYYALLSADRFDEAYDSCSTPYRAGKTKQSYLAQWEPNSGIGVVDTFRVTVSADGQTATVPALLMFSEPEGRLLYQAQVRFLWEKGSWKFDGGDFQPVE